MVKATELCSINFKKELSDLTQGNSDVAGYFTKVKRIWDELDSLDTCNHCSCECSCGGKDKTLKSHQVGRLIQFLMGLNDTYSGVRSNILMSTPLPSIDHAYSLLIQDEKQREVRVSQHSAESLNCFKSLIVLVSDQLPLHLIPLRNFSPIRVSFCRIQLCIAGF